MVLLIFLQEQPTQTPSWFTTWFPPIITWFLVVVGIIANYFLLHKSYKNEYYKKIIDKRLESYESIESILSIFKAYMEIDNKAYHTIFNSIKEYETFHSEFVEIYKKTFWLESNLATKIIQLHDFLSDNIWKKYKTDIELRQLGIEYYGQIATLGDQIIKLFYDSFVTLYDVAKFIEKQKLYFSPKS